MTHPLPPVQSLAAQVLRQQQQAWLSTPGMRAQTASLRQPCRVCDTPTTAGLLCHVCQEGSHYTYVETEYAYQAQF